MSVAAFRAFQDTFAAAQAKLAQLARECPTCWVVVARPIKRGAEVVVAAFDTEEMARTYVAAARAPEPRMVDGFWRTFRFGTLLWDYNPNLSTELVRPLMSPTFNWPDGIPVNPLPPLVGR
jgi:hypothetical protein